MKKFKKIVSYGSGANPTVKLEGETGTTNMVGAYNALVDQLNKTIEGNSVVPSNPEIPSGQ